MGRQTVTNAISKTNDLEFLFGKFKGGNFSTPYFQTTMTFKEAADWLKLVNEMPNASNLEWRIEELFQRDIDWKRVEKSIVPYLNTDGPKFFNSLTIALMPMINNEIKEYGADVKWHAPKLEKQSEEGYYDQIKTFGPVTCGYFGSGYENPDDIKQKVGHLCWNPDEICGVAIDGQHRLAAIKTYVKANPTSSIVKESRVPVILLLLEPSLGFTMTGGHTGELIPTIRKLFIDLNKNAKIVKRARQILLDDRDPLAMCVRSLVGPKLCDGLNELQEMPPTLPLTLIDWHSDQAKVDDGPYMATILGLDWAIGKGFGIKSIDDPTDHDGIEELINKLKKIMRARAINKSEDGSPLDKALAAMILRIVDCRNLQTPFTLNDEEMVQISNAFKESFNKSFCHLLTQFKPYVEVINLRKEYNTLNAKFANWFPLNMAIKKFGPNDGLTEKNLLAANVNSLQAAGISVEKWRQCVDNIIEHKNDNIAFTVVFQRALILAFIKFQKIDLKNVPKRYIHGQDDGVIIGDVDSSAGLSHAEILVKGLNKILEKKPLFLNKHLKFSNKKDFWDGSILDRGTIDYSQGASDRASDILLLIGFIQYFKSEIGTETDFKDFYTKIQIPNNGIYTNANSCFNRMITNKNNIAYRIIDDNQVGDQVELAKSRKLEILDRAEWIWDNF